MLYVVRYSAERCQLGKKWCLAAAALQVYHVIQLVTVSLLCPQLHPILPNIALPLFDFGSTVSAIVFASAFDSTKS